METSNIPDHARHLSFAQNIDFFPFNFDETDIKKENEIPRMAHLIWVGNNDRPSHFNSNVKKWRELMPDWEIRVWTNDHINTHHFPQEVIDLLHTVEKGAQKADIMRYFIMETCGGIYLDSDITPHRSLESLITHAPGAEVILCHDLPLTWKYIINAFFAAVPNHPLFKLCTELVVKATMNTHDLHMHTGPRLLGEAVSRLRGHKMILLPLEYFYRNLHYNGRFGHHFYAKDW